MLGSQNLFGRNLPCFVVMSRCQDLCTFGWKKLSPKCCDFNWKVVHWNVTKYLLQTVGKGVACISDHNAPSHVTPKEATLHTPSVMHCDVLDTEYTVGVGRVTLVKILVPFIWSVTQPTPNKESLTPLLYNALHTARTQWTRIYE